jgi:hypothetical protein
MVFTRSVLKKSLDAGQIKIWRAQGVFPLMHCFGLPNFKDTIV